MKINTFFFKKFTYTKIKKNIEELEEPSTKLNTYKITKKNCYLKDVL